MSIIFITLTVFLIAFSGLAIGVIISDRAVKGSCGGISSLMGKTSCEICALKDQCEEKGVELCEDGVSS